MALIKARTAGTQSAAARTPSASRFQYKARSAEEVKARANRSIGSRDNYLKGEVEYFSPKAGDNTVRVLPPTWEGARHYGLDLFLHYGIGPDESAYLCPDKMNGDKCPLCEERATASGAGEEDLAKALQPKGRVLVWVIDRKESSKGPLIWSMPAGLDKDIVNAAVDKSTGEIYNIDDPSENGYDVYFKREGEGIKTKYNGIQVARKPSPLSDDAAEADKWLDYVGKHPLDSLLDFRDYETLQAAYAGTTVRPAEERTGGDKGGERPKAAIPPRGSRTSTATPPPAQPPAQEAASGDEELPTWEEVHKASEADVTELVEVKGLTAEAEANDKLTSLELLQDWVCERLGIKKPTPPTSSGGASWKDRLKKGK